MRTPAILSALFVVLLSAGALADEPPANPPGGPASPGAPPPEAVPPPTDGDAATPRTRSRPGRSEDRAARSEERAAKIFSRIDADDDGRVTREEFLAARMKWFAKREGDGDKVVSRDDLHASKEKTSKRERRTFVSADRDADGQLTLAEWTLAGERLFEQIDRNRDGTITPDELTGYSRGKLGIERSRR
jgi:Ca2+-binding EF-hand superfamily protein